MNELPYKKNQPIVIGDAGFLDQDPNYIRASLYEVYFQKPPVCGIDIHDEILNKEQLFDWIESNGFILFFSKTVQFCDDSEESLIRYYVNLTTQSMITYRQKSIDHKNVKHLLSITDSDFSSSSKNKNPNKIDFLSFYSSTIQAVEEFRKTIKPIQIKEDVRNKLFMLKNTSYGSLELEEFPMECEETPIELNYGSEFPKIHSSILERLKNKVSGLYIFHGPPGTGKTSYIKHLTTLIENRRFIFVPNAMVSELFSPKLVDKLYSFRNSVLVLEDAEICVFKRDGNNNALVSGILNVTDGLLKDLLNISIIVTFNSAEINEIDPAILRKGRLKVMHKFDLLSVENANKLASYLGKTEKITKPMSLADIYNLGEPTGIEEELEKPVGFVGFTRN